MAFLVGLGMRAALSLRERTGVGDKITINLVDALMAALANAGSRLRSGVALLAGSPCSFYLDRRGDQVQLAEVVGREVDVGCGQVLFETL